MLHIRDFVFLKLQEDLGIINYTIITEISISIFFNIHNIQLRENFHLTID